jgi:hypothetical protein
MRMKIKSGILAVIVCSAIMAIVIAGCGAGGIPGAESGSGAQKSEPADSSRPADSTGTDSADVSSDKDEPLNKNNGDAGSSGGGADSSESGTGKASGVFEGQADSNFIEVTVESSSGGLEGIMVFMLDDGVKEEFDKIGLDTGDKISFEYKTNEHSQYIIVKLEKAG